MNTGRGLRFKVVSPSSVAGGAAGSAGGSLSLSPQAGGGGVSIGNSHDPLAFKSSSSSSSSGHAVSAFSSSSSSSSSLQSGHSFQNSINNNNNSTSITISAGPLSYEYTLHDILFHYGRSDDRGSEHTINETSFPAELQLYFYNSQLYNSWDESVSQPNGLAAISVLIQLARSASSSNTQLKHLFHGVESVKHKGTWSKVHKLSLSHLIPSMAQYMTYEGSLTQPSCVETVQWIILNRPIYMTSSELAIIRNTIVLEGQGDGNFRPTQSMNSRSLRTNIWNGGGGAGSGGPSSRPKTFSSSSSPSSASSSSNPKVRHLIWKEGSFHSID